MNMNIDEGYWKLILLAAGAVIAYGAKFISKKLVTDDEKKQTKLIIGLKILGFVLVALAAVAVMFL